MKCPGQDRGHWKPEDIFEEKCPGCGAPVEFFKDDKWRECRKCGTLLKNPRVVANCEDWCACGESCGLGVGEISDPDEESSGT